MLARMRALKFASALAAALLSGGAAWAASGASVPTFGHVRASDDSTTTTVEETTTTVEETTTTVEETPTTVEETPTTVPDESPKSSDDCKPGWGYGDTNHCHTGPPGLLKQNTEPGDQKHAGKDDRHEQDSPETDSPETDSPEQDGPEQGD
jgi:hypothetical protein